MDKKQLPVFGVGPIYVICCLILTILGITLRNTSLLKNGNLSNLKFIAILIGVVFVLMGCLLWIKAVILQKIGDEIKKGKLVTTGIYSIVRNPIYSAFLLIFTGVLMIAHNIYLLLLPLIYYFALTFLMKQTEEKWLLEKFGDRYVEYCKRVNRIIPWRKYK